MERVLQAKAQLERGRKPPATSRPEQKAAGGGGECWAGEPARPSQGQWAERF